MGAKPGDIFNGHILGQDNVWHRLAGGEQAQSTTASSEADSVPVQTARPAPVPRAATYVPHALPVHGQPVERVAPAKSALAPSYWVRYHRRWFRTAWIVGLITGVAMAIDLAVKESGSATPLSMLMDFVFGATAATLDGLIFGSLVNFLVALVPGAPEASLQPGGQRGGVCPGCDKTVTPEAWVMHPRYCVGRVAEHSQSDGGPLAHAPSPRPVQPSGQARATRPASPRVPTALICPGCDKTVAPEAWVLHPRYCVARTSAQTGGGSLAPEPSPPFPQPFAQPGAVLDASTSDLARRRLVGDWRCPGCGKNVQPDEWLNHPRFCVGRAASQSDSGLVRAEPSEIELLRELADRLSPLFAEWDVRVMDFDGEQAVVVDQYPNRIDSDGNSVSVGMVALYAVHDGQWWAQTLMLDADGDPMLPAPPAAPIGILAGDQVGAVRRLLSVLVASYRSAADFQPTGGPEDALVMGWRPHARSALDRLTDDRVSRIALFPGATADNQQPAPHPGAFHLNAEPMDSRP